MIDLYRCFDDAGCLLYVGISRSAFLRATEHHTKPWWPTVCRVEVQHLAVSREVALQVEARVIRSERPRHNIAATQPRRPRRQAGHLKLLQRREKGSGSIYFDQEMDRWVAQIDLGRSDDGRRRRKKLVAKTRVELEQRMAAAR